MKKYNILFLASWYPNKEKPFAGNFIRNHAVAVSEFCNVYVIYTRALKQKERFLTEEKKHEGITEIITYYKKINCQIPVISFVLKLFNKLRAYKKTYKYLLRKVEKIDLVHVNVFLQAGVFAKILYKKYKIPYIITEHWTKFLSISDDSFSFLEKLMIKLINKSASVICPVSENLKYEMIKFGIKNKYIVIPNVVKTDIFFPSKENSNMPKIRFLHISHLKDDHKNISGILETFKEISKIRPDFFLTISGNGDVESHMKYADIIEFPKSLIRFEGSKTQNEVAEAMRENNAFILFSNYENLPVVISEAHVSGIPVVSSDVGGISEMINETNGVLVEKGNKKMLLEKVLLTMDNIRKFNKNKISAVAVERYGYESVGKQYYNVYKSVIQPDIKNA